MKLIGITGGVGSGKTAVLQYIREHYSCRILLADEISHQVMRAGGSIHDELVELLRRVPGEEPLTDAAGEIRHSAMASRIFRDSGALQRVNDLLHPAVKEFVLEAVRQERRKEETGAPDRVDYLFLEAALLIECGYGSLVDEMWYIYCSLDERRKRLRESRGYSDEKVDSILRTQLSEAEFRKGSDVVIDNSGSFDEACRQVDARLAQRDRRGESAAGRAVNSL